MAGYKINSNKSVAFLYAKDKEVEKEIREIIPFAIGYKGYHLVTNQMIIGHTIGHEHYEVSWCDSDQTSKRSVWQELQVSEERNQRRFQKMERSPMLMDWQD